MSRDNRTWREKQQAQQQEIAACETQAVALRQRLIASQQRLDDLEAEVLAQQHAAPRLLRWLFNRQLKRIKRQRAHVTRLLAEIDRLEQTCHDLEEAAQQPPPAPQRPLRVITLPAETFFFLLLMAYAAWLVNQWLRFR